LTVTVEAPSFQTAVVQNVEVQVSQSARADVHLEVGSTATTIEVTAAAPLLNSESATLGTIVTNREIVNLPLNGRSFYDLAKLTPGATTLPGGGNLLRFAPIIFRVRRSAAFAACRRPSYLMEWT
jgi:hypothetical protein